MKHNNFISRHKLLFAMIILSALIAIALIFVAIFVENVESLISLIASIFGVFLSLFAITYAAYSSEKTDEKLKAIIALGQSMQKTESEVRKLNENAESIAPSDRAKILEQYKKDLDAINKLGIF